MKRHTILILIVTILLVGFVSFVHPNSSSAKDTGWGLSDQEGFSSRSVGSWFTTGDMFINRRNHTATLLPNGEVLVVGGTNPAYLDSAELYNPFGKTWVLTDSMSTPRAFHTATLLANGTVLVVGGLIDSDPFTIINSVEIFNPVTGTWAAANPMVTARYNHTATLLNDGRVLVAGGYNPTDGHLASAEMFEPLTGLWLNAGSMSVTRYLHTATLLEDGKVLVTGGYGNQMRAVTDIFNPDTTSWSTTVSMNTGRYVHAAALLPDGKVLVAGGYNSSSNTFLDSTEIYDPDLETWSVVNPLIQARGFHQMLMLPNQEIFVVGGENAVPGPNYLGTAELMGELGVWTSAGSMFTARTNHTATLLNNGQVLVAGGNNTVSTLKSAELYSNNAISGTISCLGIYENSIHTVFVDLHTSTGEPPVESTHIHCGDSYLFYDMPDGSYYVGTWLDLDDSGGGPPGPLEPHAWYEDTLGNPEQIPVSGDLVVSGIDIQLEWKSALLFLPMVFR